MPSTRTIRRLTFTATASVRPPVRIVVPDEPAALVPHFIATPDTVRNARRGPHGDAAKGDAR